MNWVVSRVSKSAITVDDVEPKFHKLDQSPLYSERKLKLN